MRLKKKIESSFSIFPIAVRAQVVRNLPWIPLQIFLGGMGKIDLPKAMPKDFDSARLVVRVCD